MDSFILIIKIRKIMSNEGHWTKNNNHANIYNELTIIDKSDTCK